MCGFYTKYLAIISILFIFVSELHKVRCLTNKNGEKKYEKQENKQSYFQPYHC